jgi:hypothetical protein
MRTGSLASLVILILFYRAGSKFQYTLNVARAQGRSWHDPEGPRRLISICKISTAALVRVV